MSEYVCLALASSLWHALLPQTGRAVLYTTIGLSLVIIARRLPEVIGALGEAIERIMVQRNDRRIIEGHFARGTRPGNTEPREPPHAPAPREAPPDERAHLPGRGRPLPRYSVSHAPRRSRSLSQAEKDRRAAERLLRAVDKGQSVEDFGQLPLQLDGRGR